ncbi:MAG: methionine synthase [Deltaproteobacteria bacterium]|nr:methionine synthase [Deltaproteobacteria bacterium]
MTPLFFESIPVTLPRPAIYRRLGYRKEATRISTGQREEVEGYIADALPLLQLKGSALRLPIELEKPLLISLPGGNTFASRKLARFLKDAREIVLMGATAGTAIMEAIQADIGGRNVTRGVVLDATASEVVDAGLDWIMGYFRQSLRREGKTLLNSRFSAGYGDFALENQQLMHRLLQMDRLNVTITESCLLVPEKSVTAVTGIV